LVIKEKVQKEEEKRRRRDILSFSTSPMKWSVPYRSVSRITLSE
jgi:hypothetical protein